MTDNLDHAAFVDAWLDGATQELTPEAYLELFGASLAALWSSASTTLGDVTLTAIVDRVLCNATERFDFLSGLAVGEKVGIQIDDLRGRAGSLSAAQVRAGLRFVLVEFLEVIGSLTADILTPDLHAALAKVTRSKVPPGKVAAVSVAASGLAGRDWPDEPSTPTSSDNPTSRKVKDRSS